MDAIAMEAHDLEAGAELHTMGESSRVVKSSIALKRTNPKFQYVASAAGEAAALRPPPSGS